MYLTQLISKINTCYNFILVIGFSSILIILFLFIDIFPNSNGVLISFETIKNFDLDFKNLSNNLFIFRLVIISPLITKNFLGNF